MVRNFTPGLARAHRRRGAAGIISLLTSRGDGHRRRRCWTRRSLRILFNRYGKRQVLETISGWIDGGKP